MHAATITAHAFAPPAASAAAPANVWRAARLNVRPLRPGDTARLKAFFGGLSAAARRWRFHGAVNEVPSAWIERMAHPDPHREAALFAEATHGDEVHAVGEARYVADGAAPDTRELAIVVADGWQGRGIGVALLRGLEQAARRQGVSRLFGDVQRDNLAMLALAERAGFRVRGHPADATLVRIVKEVGGLTAPGAEARRPN